MCLYPHLTVKNECNNTEEINLKGEIIERSWQDKSAKELFWNN